MSKEEFDNDLDKELSEAYDKMQEPSEEPVEEELEVEEEAPEETPEEVTEETPEEATEEASEEASEEATEEALQEAPEEALEEQAETTPTKEPVTNAPNSWRPEAKVKFNKLPKWAKEEILRREDDMKRGVDKVYNEANNRKTGFEPLDQYAPMFQQMGTDAAGFARGAANLFYGLQTGSPEQKRMAIQQLAQRYAIPLEQAQPQEGAAQVDPAIQQELNHLRQQFAHQQQWQRQQEKSQREAQDKQIQDAYTNFENATDENGNLSHPFIDNVWDDMMLMVKATYDGTQNYSTVLKESYETAVWKNPETRAAMQALQGEQQSAKAQAEAKKRALEARKNKDVNVDKRGEHSTHKGKPTGSVDDTLSEVYDRLNAQQ